MNGNTKPSNVAAPVAWLHTVRETGGDREPDAALSFAPDNFPLNGMFESLSVEPLYDGTAVAECSILRLRLKMAREAALQARAHLLNGPKHSGWTLTALRLALDALDGLRDDDGMPLDGSNPNPPECDPRA